MEQKQSLQELQCDCCIKGYMGKHVKHYNIYTARAEFNKNVKNSHKLQQNVKYVDCSCCAVLAGGRQTIFGTPLSILRENTPMFRKH